MAKRTKSQIREQTRQRRAKLKEIKRNVTVDGRTFPKSFYGPTKELAEQAYRDFLTPPLGAVQDLADRLTVNSVPWWFVTKLFPLKAHRRAKTVDALELTARHLLPELQDTMIWDLTATTLTQALDRIAAKQTLRNKSATPKKVRLPDGSIAIVNPTPIYKPLSASTVNKCRQLGLDINHLAHEEMSAKVSRINPKRIPIREEALKSVNVYTPPMMRALIKAAEGSSACVPSIVYCFLGLRLNEGIGLRRCDLQASKTLEIRMQDKEGELTDQLKSENAKRDFPLPDPLYELLKPFAGRDSWRMAQARTRGSGAKLVDKPLLESNVPGSLAAAMRRAGLHILTPHELRHSFSTWLDQEGCPQSIRLALMGQSRRAVADRYSHAQVEEKRKWLGKLWDASLEPWVKPSTATPSGRAKGSAGESNGRSKLKATDIPIIRERLMTESACRIAKDYGVDPGAIRNIKIGKTWQNM